MPKIITHTKKNWTSSCQDTGHWGRDGKQKRASTVIAHLLPEKDFKKWNRKMHPAWGQRLVDYLSWENKINSPRRPKVNRVLERKELYRKELQRSPESPSESVIFYANQGKFMGKEKNLRPEVLPKGLEVLSTSTQGKKKCLFPLVRLKNLICASDWVLRRDSHQLWEMSSPQKTKPMKTNWLQVT